MAKALAQFTVTRSGEEFLLMIEDADGDTSEFTADFDQLDLITEAIEDMLDREEEDMLEVDEDEADEDDQEPQED